MIDLVFLGPPRKDFAKTIDELVLRCTRFHPVRFHYVDKPPSRRMPELKKVLADSRWIVGCDEHGRNFDSTQFAGAVQNWIETHRNISFVVGDAFSLPEEINFHEKLALSKMTLPHDFARVLLAEQIYRALTIANHHPYHHA